MQMKAKTMHQIDSLSSSASLSVGSLNPLLDRTEHSCNRRGSLDSKSLSRSGSFTLPSINEDDTIYNSSILGGYDSSIVGSLVEDGRSGSFHSSCTDHEDSLTGSSSTHDTLMDSSLNFSKKLTFTVSNIPEVDEDSSSDNEVDVNSSKGSLPSLTSIFENDTVVGSQSAGQESWISSSTASFATMDASFAGSKGKIASIAVEAHVNECKAGCKVEQLCPVLKAEDELVSVKKALRWDPNINDHKNLSILSNLAGRPQDHQLQEETKDAIPVMAIRQVSLRSLNGGNVSIAQNCLGSPMDQQVKGAKQDTAPQIALRQASLRSLGSSTGRNICSPMEVIAETEARDSMPKRAMRMPSPAISQRKRVSASPRTKKCRPQIQP